MNYNKDNYAKLFIKAQINDTCMMMGTISNLTELKSISVGGKHTYYWKLSHIFWVNEVMVLRK